MEAFMIYADFGILIYILIWPLIILTIYLYCCYKLNYWKKRGVPQLHNTNLIFGNFTNGLLFRTGPGVHLGRIYRDAPENKPFVGFYIFHKPCLLLKDPQLIKDILIQAFDNFCDRHFASSQQKDTIEMKNLFGLKNPAWKYLRRKITPTLTRGKLIQMFPMMLESGKPMMDYLKKQVDDNNTTVNIQDVIYRYTIDLIANVGLGIKTNSFDSEDDSEFTNFFMNFFSGFKRMISLVIIFFVPEVTTILRRWIYFDSSYVRKIFWTVMNDREKNGITRGDYIDTIIELKNEIQSNIFKFEGNNLVSQVGPLFSGFESSSTTTSFTLMALGKHKVYQDLAREDIRKAINEHGWTMEAFNEMKYVDQCIAEILRLYPAVSTVDRIALNNYKIPNTNIIIEKGTPIIISLFGLHYDQKFFDEPEVFNPERFRRGTQISDAYMPFGAGLRTCVGSKIGVLHVKIGLAMILSNYEVYQKPEQMNELDSRATFTMAARGIDLELKKL